MPPLKAAGTKKSSATLNSENSVAKTMTTRSSKSISVSLKKENAKDVSIFSKRKASPIKGNTLKRSALGNITNAIETKCIINSGKKTANKISSVNVTKHTISTTAKISQALPTSKSTAVPVDSNHIKSFLPPLPKSRLKPPLPTIPTTKNNVGLASMKLISSTNTIGKPVSSTSTADRVVFSSAITADKLAPSVSGRVDEATIASVKPTTAKSPSVVKKPAKASMCKITVKPKGMVMPAPRRSSGRRSTLDSSESSLYVSALSDVLDDVTSNEKQQPQPLINIDEEYLNDPHQCAVYAYEIFEYLKTRESRFQIKDYMTSQPGLSQHIRAILVDWMVEIQENFELNHETLYLAVKLVDTYFSKVRVSKSSVQLVGATAMLIAAKYDERIPPSIEDFLYICNEAYDRPDMTRMEVNILRVVDFQLGYPLSYRFLRRYARCAKVQMPLLTLARFILELALMDYSTITLSDSKMAAAALYLAFKMKKEQAWDATLVHFSGYEVKDFLDTVVVLNNTLHQKPRQSLATIRNKYSHKIFYEVAKIPLVSSEHL